MYKLKPHDYKKVLPLIKSEYQLSVFSVIHGIMQGKIFVNNLENPTAALIQTSECNLLAGNVDDDTFRSTISDELGFWDSVIPDSEEWIRKIPSVHADHFVRQYTRCYYSLNQEDFNDTKKVLPQGFVVEQVDPDFLRSKDFKYADEIIRFMDDWGGDKRFMYNGGGAYVRNEDEIISRSMWDCTYDDKVEIGIKTIKNKYRKMGFGIIAVAASIKACFERGYKTIGWHCVEANIGSRAIASKLGFKLKGTYTAFTPYPPIENPADLLETEWNEWAEYFENSAKIEPGLWSECLCAYIKANNVARANEILAIHKEKKPFEHNFNGLVRYLHSIGMATNFNDSWAENVK